MKDDTITEILDQMRYARLHKLVEDFSYTLPYRLYIKFCPDTTPKTKMALQDYFLKKYKSTSHFLENASILRIDL